MSLLVVYMKLHFLIVYVYDGRTFRFEAQQLLYHLFQEIIRLASSLFGFLDILFNSQQTSDATNHIVLNKSLEARGLEASGPCLDASFACFFST